MLRVEDQDEFNAKFDLWLETLDYDYKAEENKARFMEDKAKYITENLDHERWSHRLDKVLSMGKLNSNCPISLTGTYYCKSYLREAFTFANWNLGFQFSKR